MKLQKLWSPLILFFILALYLPVAVAQTQIIKFSCSAQIARAFGWDVVKLLKEKDGIDLDIKIVSSGTALNRLENGFADVAAITIPLPFKYQESGYVGIPFRKDPVSIITRDDIKVDNIKSSEVVDIFKGTLINWKALGGQNLTISKLVPCEETGIYGNFEKLFMGLNKIHYDYMTYCSITTIPGVKSLPGAISFISHGAAVKEKGIKFLKIDGISASSSSYKYYQIFTLVTKGRADGNVKNLIDVALSKRGQALMKAKGMQPILP